MFFLAARVETGDHFVAVHALGAGARRGRRSPGLPVPDAPALCRALDNSMPEDEPSITNKYRREAEHLRHAVN
jgi:hypothetical protein